jgi:hypothetical protein
MYMEYFDCFVGVTKAISKTGWGRLDGPNTDENTDQKFGPLTPLPFTLEHPTCLRTLSEMSQRILLDTALKFGEQLHFLIE